MTITPNKVSSIVLALMLSVSLCGTNAGAAGFSFTRNLALGAHGDDVSALQTFLIAGGFLKVPVPTGYFGPLTKTTLSAWQASVGISPATGFLGSISRRKMNATARITSPDTTATQSAPATATATSTAVATSPAPTPARAPAAVAVSFDGSPVRLKIPRINVDAGFQYNGLNPDGAMEIPNNVVDAGWFTGSVRPGEKGTSVITGHVAQIRGGVITKPGVFFTLRDLRAGDTLAILNDKGESVTFVVRETRNYDPSADATDVFTAKDNGAHLNIITCEGTWHPDQLSYSQRLVVFTDAIK